MVKLSSNRNGCVEYPLKIIGMDEFLLNPDEFLWSTVSKRNQMLNSLQISNFKDETLGETIEINYEKPGLVNVGESNPSTTLLFMDSKIYRDLIHENKSNFSNRSINNLIVLDRQINFYSIDEIDKYLQLFANSQRILLHGLIKSKLNNNNNKNSQTKINKKTNINNNCNNNLTNVLFMLNSKNDFVKTNLIDGLTNLKENFTNGRRAVFEVNFLNYYYYFILFNH
jgi:hypothetical protein